MFIVYQLISASMLQVFWIISYSIDQKTLYCSHRDYGATLLDPTAFCYILGQLDQMYVLGLTITTLPTIGDSLKKQKSLYKVLKPSIKPPYNSYGSS